MGIAVLKMMMFDRCVRRESGYFYAKLKRVLVSVSLVHLNYIASLHTFS